MRETLTCGVELDLAMLRSFRIVPPIRLPSGARVVYNRAQVLEAAARPGATFKLRRLPSGRYRLVPNEPRATCVHCGCSFAAAAGRYGCPNCHGEGM